MYLSSFIHFVLLLCVEIFIDTCVRYSSSNGNILVCSITVYVEVHEKCNLFLSFLSNNVKT